MCKKILLGVVIVVIALISIGIWFPQKQIPKHTEPIEKVTIANAKISLSSLVLIADKKGFFEQYGVDVTIKEFKGGKQALKNSFFVGEADMATTAEVPIVANSFEHQNFRIVSVIGNSDNEMRIVGRRDSGISKPEDLRGKNIGTKSSSAVHFFLYSFLLNYNLGVDDVNLKFGVDGDELVKLLVSGELDAISIREPFISKAKDLLDENVILFEEPGIYTKTFNLVVTDEFAKNNGVAVERVVKALIEAEDFVKNNKEESINIIAKELKISRFDLEDLWPDINLKVHLDQALLLSLEEEARWMINNNLISSKKIPNYLDLLYTDALDSVKPEVVTIIR